MRVGDIATEHMLDMGLVKGLEFSLIRSHGLARYTQPQTHPPTAQQELNILLAIILTLSQQLLHSTRETD